MRKITFHAGEYYHLYNRGVNHQPIFFNDDNWGYFIKLLRRHFHPEFVDIIAYCLMPNHYHLLVYLKTDNLGLKMIQPLSVAYTKAINHQQNRVGHLFEGPFKGILIDRDEYLLHLSRYIHLNPVFAGLVKRPEEWKFSSYQDYVGLRNGTLVKPYIVLSQFSSRQAYAGFVESYVEVDNKIIKPFMLD